MASTTMLSKVSFGTTFKLTKRSPYRYEMIRRDRNPEKERFLIERTRTGFRKWVYDKRVYF